EGHVGRGERGAEAAARLEAIDDLPGEAQFGIPRRAGGRIIVDAGGDLQVDFLHQRDVHVRADQRNGEFGEGRTHHLRQELVDRRGGDAGRVGAARGRSVVDLVEFRADGELEVAGRQFEQRAVELDLLVIHQDADEAGRTVAGQF